MCDKCYPTGYLFLFNKKILCIFCRHEKGKQTTLFDFS